MAVEGAAGRRERSVRPRGEKGICGECEGRAGHQGRRPGIDFILIDDMITSGRPTLSLLGLGVLSRLTISMRRGDMVRPEPMALMKASLRAHWR